MSRLFKAFHRLIGAAGFGAAALALSAGSAWAQEIPKHSPSKPIDARPLRVDTPEETGIIIVGGKRRTRSKEQEGTRLLNPQPLPPQPPPPDPAPSARGGGQR